MRDQLSIETWTHQWFIEWKILIYLRYCILVITYSSVRTSSIYDLLWFFLKMYLRIRNVEHNCKFSIKSWKLFSKYNTFQCDNYLDETFIWRYTLTKAEKCRGMLGCHYPIHQEPGIPEQDIVYEVLIRTAPNATPFTSAFFSTFFAKLKAC